MNPNVVGVTKLLKVPENVIVPVNVVGLSEFAFKSNADCVAVEIYLFRSEVLSTLDESTIDLVRPVTVPVTTFRGPVIFTMFENVILPVTISLPTFQMYRFSA